MQTRPDDLARRPWTAPRDGGADGSALTRRPSRPPRTGLRVPVAFGYVQSVSSETAGTCAERIRSLEATAQLYGWALTETIIDDDPTQPMIGFRRLRATALAADTSGGSPDSVLLLSWRDLADAVEDADRLRRRFEHVTGAPIVIASTIRPYQTPASNSTTRRATNSDPPKSALTVTPSTPALGTTVLARRAR
ncbi:MAG: hypothetical protein QG622_1825 [Actinomycetota bacterium]|nr:hypothetical protein [Actinomycetota bacterium]